MQWDGLSRTWRRGGR